MCSFQITPHIEERVHTTPGLQLGEEEVCHHLGQKGEGKLKKLRSPNSKREMDSGNGGGNCPSLQVPNATQVLDQSIEKGVFKTSIYVAHQS